jgi:hypothetical protein
MLNIREWRLSRAPGLLAVCSLLGLTGCAAHYAQVPPRLDLAPYGRVALVTFSSDRSHAAMTALATQRFAEALLRSQSGIEVLELSATDSTVRALGAHPDPADVAQAVGQMRNVAAVFVGRLDVSGSKPQGSLSTSGLNVRTAVTANLSVQMLSTRSGGTLWRSSSTASGTVGQFATTGGLPTVAVRDQQEAYGEVMDRLVADLTRDMRPTWVKQ